MTGYTQLSVKENGLNGALAGLFRKMIETGVVDAVMAPSRRPEGGVMQVLVSDPRQMEAVDPFAPVVPVSSARLVSALTANPSGRPVAVVMRSCEIRALVELVKLKQADLGDLVLVGIDCLGRVENTDFKKLETRLDGKVTESFLAGALGGKADKAGFDLVTACRICESPVAENVDMRLCVIGGDGGAVWVEWVGEKGEAIRAKLGLAADPTGPNGREAALSKLVAARTGARDKLFEEFRGKVHSFEALADHLAGCVNCYNCRVACPVCYCRQCVFCTDTFRHSGDQFMSWADKRGAIKMPTDTLFYHLTRLVHMSALCVGCGQCTSACPNGISLLELFRTTAEKTQARFGYKPGRALDEPQPLAVFKEDELGDVTGQVK